jgi:tRNA dimethylallyltransferase
MTDSTNLPAAVCIMGPTASGKTDLAVHLVEHFPVDIISVDSALVYREMNIGTAKPEPNVLARAPHRLIDFLDPSEPYSAARFCQDALREMQDIQANGRTPLLVGGTMMYFRALLQGLAELPSADEALRDELMQEAEQKGWQAMHDQLAEIDPQAAKRIHPNDPQRIQRAIEVYRLTGMSLTDWQAQPVQPFPYQPVLIGLVPSDRAVLHTRIAARFHRMLELGLVQEVEALYARGDLNIEMPSMRAVGYRQVWQYLDGQLGYEEMVDKAIAATRQLAKRQLTWLRSMPHVKKFDSLNKDLADEVLKALSPVLIN